MPGDHFSLFFLVLYVPIAALLIFLVLTVSLSLGWKKVLSARSKAVLISGCDSGIGLRVAEHLSCLGLHVFAACLSLQSEGAKSLNRHNNSKNVTVFELDITSRSSIDSAVALVSQKLQKLEIRGAFVCNLQVMN